MAMARCCGVGCPRRRDIAQHRDEFLNLAVIKRYSQRLAAALAISGLVFVAPPADVRFFTSPSFAAPAFASGLFQMPPTRLKNRYFLVRAGESEYETSGIINTNPVSKTSLENGLSEAGKKQVVQAAVKLKNLGACKDSCWIWPSITQRSYQAAELIAYVNDISRSRIVPEYSFLDARGLGAYEGKTLDAVNEVYETDVVSLQSRPPPNTNGTPNESVADVFVRVTQLMSILETQYAGESIVIVSPDSDNLSVLQAGLYGLDLRRHSQLSFAPGEVREVDIKSIPKPSAPLSGYLPN
ncbi:uncharacterized protein LOC9638197 [Selaginella moellendorffii]|uniref:uncharacterized protein LOC9638197 n=1 Tax=Selaginella moellendorffii TaxID=88036 RepID=UPI000D1CBA2B|nr:uncharacterized protein LOC9638197 [Selaginella moellendorffii]|eukprot:XP_002974896.2 uncharacterized protein LOC9638197 [Selaginella moellendorffii]